MKQFVAILGRQPELSVAELCAVAHRHCVTIEPLNDFAAFVQGDETWVDRFALFGGLVKVGEVLAHVPNIDGLFADDTVRQLHAALPVKGKVVFGISAYGSPSFIRSTQAFSKRIKVFLAENGRPARFLLGERGTLSSVVVDKERLVERGMELLLFERPREIVIAKTVAVQHYEEFSTRDYGRPQRNATSGMLPPKLARILLHLADVDESTTLMDPFCGSGTILQEALLLGFQSLIGSDQSDKAIRETKANLAWLAKHEQRELPAVRSFQSDVNNLGRVLLPATIGCVVTEPYLGPPQKGGEDVLAIRAELEVLYQKAFRVFAQLLEDGGKVVFLLPVFFRNAKPHFIMNLDAWLTEGFRLIDPLPPEWLTAFEKRLTFRKTLLYIRPGQRVGREILLLQRRRA
ncbi:MAG: hypothetical protein V1778_00785 [bacterium]